MNHRRCSNQRKFKGNYPRYDSLSCAPGAEPEASGLIVAVWRARRHVGVRFRITQVTVAKAQADTVCRQLSAVARIACERVTCTIQKVKVIADDCI